MEGRHRIRVRYGESDQMGVAHHGAFIAWLEEARIEWLRQRGLSYRELEAQGTLMPVVELHLRYRRPLRFDDEVELATEAIPVGPSRVTFRTRLLQEGELYAEGEVTVAAVGRDGRPRRLPPIIAEAQSRGASKPEA